MLWYSPLMFGKLWAKEMNRSMDQKPTPKVLCGALLVALFVSFGLACMTTHLHIHSTMKGAMFGFFTALWFMVPVVFSNVLWAGKPCKVFLIDSAFFLVYMPVMGALMGMMH